DGGGQGRLADAWLTVEPDAPAATAGERSYSRSEDGEFVIAPDGVVVAPRGVHTAILRGRPGQSLGQVADVSTRSLGLLTVRERPLNRSGTIDKPRRSPPGTRPGRRWRRLRQSTGRVTMTAHPYIHDSLSRRPTRLLAAVATAVV